VLWTSVCQFLKELEVEELDVAAHAYNPSLSGGGDPEDLGLMPVQEKWWQDPISTNSWAWWYPPVIPARGASRSRPAQAKT
jgi:hypothetical protein